jgi:PAS domain-containing protein
MEMDLSRVVDALPGLVWTALPERQFDFFNQRRCEYTGVGVEELRGRGSQAAIHPEDLPEVLPNDGPGATFSCSIPPGSEAVKGAHGLAAIGPLPS